MDEMRELGVGIPENHNDDRDTQGEGARGRIGGHADGDDGSRIAPLSSDCYAPLVVAYAQASMWDRTIEAYHQGFAGGQERVEPVDYRVSLKV